MSKSYAKQLSNVSPKVLKQIDSIIETSTKPLPTQIETLIPEKNPKLIIPSTVSLTHEYLNPFEKAQIIAYRADMLNLGAPTTLKLNRDRKIMKDGKEVTESLEIARLELQNRKIPVTIVRKSPNGDTLDVNPNKLLYDIK